MNAHVQAAHASSERLLVYTPLGRDGPLTEKLLSARGYTVTVCRGMEQLCGELPKGAGAVLIAEEALAQGGHRCLVEAVRTQPPWSDLPIIVFGAAHVGDRLSPRRLEGLRALGNAAQLDRPVSLGPLISTVDSALRARRRQYEVRQTIEQRDQFLAMLGHELRNPLAAITFAMEALELANDAEAKQRQLDVVRRQARHLAHLVDDLLDVARVTSGKVTLRKERLDLAELVTRCAQAHTPLASESGLTLEVTNEGPVPVDGDPLRLEQVISNLLTNAIKYTPAGGVRVKTGRDGTDAVVEVKDTGVGMTPEMLRTVFDLFVQVPGALDRSRGGLGIGLTLVRHLVELHGGRVTADSDGPDAGSRFLLHLPLAAGPVATREPSAAVESVPSRGGILVIDDSDDLRESLREVFEALGHEVATAADGVEGLERLLALRPGVALVDLGLPGLDGYEVARRARAALGKQVHLIAVSGYGQQRDKAAALEAGFDRHLTKPVSLSTLLACLPGAAPE